MARMLLVRHGQSEWNAEGRWQGQADPPLSDLGRHQARTAATRLGALDAIVASPLARAADTARLIGDGLGVGPVLLESDLMERDAGEWMGLTRHEIEQRWPGWLESHRRPVGFEEDDEVLVRAVAALERIAAELAGAEVLVVSHGGVIRAVERRYGDPAGRVPNLGGRWLEHRDGTIVLGERIVLVGEDEITVPAAL